MDYENGLTSASRQLKRNIAMAKERRKVEEELKSRQERDVLYQSLNENKRRAVEDNVKKEKLRKHGRALWSFGVSGGVLVVACLFGYLTREPWIQAATAVKEKAVEVVDGPSNVEVKLPEATSTAAETVTAPPAPMKIAEDVTSDDIYKYLGKLLSNGTEYDFSAGTLWKASTPEEKRVEASSILESLAGKPFTVLKVQHNRGDDRYCLYCDFKELGEYFIGISKINSGFVLFEVDNN